MNTHTHTRTHSDGIYTKILGRNHKKLSLVVNWNKKARDWRRVWQVSLLTENLSVLCKFSYLGYVLTTLKMCQSDYIRWRDYWPFLLVGFLFIPLFMIFKWGVSMQEKNRKEMWRWKEIMAMWQHSHSQAIKEGDGRWMWENQTLTEVSGMRQGLRTRQGTPHDMLYHKINFIHII